MINRAESNDYVSITFAHEALHLLPSGCCYWPANNTLIVSDLHLEKGAYFAARGNPLPTSDTRHTLLRLQHVIEQYNPKTVICLGDNFHYSNAHLTMHSSDLNLLASLCNRVPNWCWILGNHDKNTQIHLANSYALHATSINDINFCHQFDAFNAYQIIGHYHPKITVKPKRQVINGKCFVVSNHIIIMPAFGSFTGGLDVNDPVYRAIIKHTAHYYLTCNERIFLVK